MDKITRRIAEVTKEISRAANDNRDISKAIREFEKAQKYSRSDKFDMFCDRAIAFAQNAQLIPDSQKIIDELTDEAYNRWRARMAKHYGTKKTSVMCDNVTETEIKDIFRRLVEKDSLIPMITGCDGNI